MRPAVTVECKVLGPVEATVNGHAAPADLLWRRHLALLVYLARSPRLTRTRDHLIGLLWPDKDESAARHSLREAVRVLRRAAGTDAVETAGQQVRLAEDAVALDVDALELLASGEEWEPAAALIAGEFMEGFAVPDASDMESWLAGERVRWRARCIDVFDRCGDALLREGRLQHAAAVAERAMLLDSQSEIAVRLAMRVAALRGDRAAALAAYDAFAGQLREETGRDPGSETTLLAARIQHERRPPPVVAEPAGTVVPRRTPLVGRERDLRALCGAWDDVRAGRGSGLILIEGDAGLGKTRLLDELCGRARLEGGATTAIVRLVEADRKTDAGALFALAGGGLLEAPGVPGARPEALATFAASLTSWRDRFPGVGSSAPVSAETALRDVVRAALDEGPVVLAIDDAHWLDRTSLLAIEALLRDVHAASLAIVATVAPHPRREELDRMRATLGRDINGTAVTLAPLSGDAIRALVRWAFPRYRDDEVERLSRRVLVDSAGLPLLAVDLIHAISIGLDVVKVGTGAWPQPFQTLEQSLPGDLPDTVVAAIRMAFRRLGSAAQTVLATASVMPERVTADTLIHPTGLDRADIVAALDELEHHRWMVTDASGYGFVARIVRDVIARDMLTGGQRRRILDLVEGLMNSR